MLRIWLLAVVGIIMAYEAVRYLVPLIWHRRYRLPMIALVAASIYPHYYGWWNFFNYLNEEFYIQWYHQLFFSVTELLSTAVCLHLSNSENNLKPWKLLIILGINTMHIIVGSLDQFVTNVLHHQGQQFEAARDIGLMVPDILHVLVAYFEMRLLADKQSTSIISLFYREEILLCVLIVTLFSILGKVL